MNRATRAANPAVESTQYVALPASVLQDRRLDRDDLLTLMSIRYFDWGEQSTEHCIAPTETLVELARSSRSTLKRSIKRLVALGYLHPPEERFEGKVQLANRLRLTHLAFGRALRKDDLRLPEMPATQATLRVEDDGEGGATRTPGASTRTPRVATGTSPTVPPDPPPGFHVDHIIDQTQVDQAKIQQQHARDAGGAAAARFGKVTNDEVLEPLDDPFDVERLRDLDRLGCDDSERALCAMLSAIRMFERARGEEPDAMRVRALYDGARRSRRVSARTTENPYGQLRHGVEHGYLLRNPDFRRYKDTITERARAAAEVPQKRAPEDPRWLPVLEELKKTISAPKASMAHGVRILRFDSGILQLGAPTPFGADFLRSKLRADIVRACATLGMAVNELVIETAASPGSNRTPGVST